MEHIGDYSWRKSSYSTNGAECVEVGLGPEARSVLVRDTKDRLGPVLRFTPGAWRTFGDQLKAGPNLTRS